LFREFQRLAKKRGVSEPELMKRALELAKQEKGETLSDARGSTRDFINVEHVGRVSLDVARKIYSSISKHFGGRTKLDAAARKKRAKEAAEARWRRRS
jgi:hypothetical protein